MLLAEGGVPLPLAEHGGGLPPPLLCAVISGDVEALRVLAAHGMRAADDAVHSVDWLHGRSAAEELRAIAP